MIDRTLKKQITLSEIPEAVRGEFGLANVAGRDAIAAQIEADIDEYCIKAYTDKKPRSHLGASKIGVECDAAIWFDFRWMVREKINGRKARYFNRGHLVEDRIIEWLTGCGFDVQQVTADNGKQIRIADCGNHFGGSCDGNTLLSERYWPELSRRDVTRAPLILLEFKTANAGNFPDIRNTGVRKAKPQYWIQMCVYGYKLNLQYVLFICIGKNDDDIDVELLELDLDLGRANVERAFNIINSQSRPQRISSDATFWKCKMCSAHKVCHLGEPVVQQLPKLSSGRAG
jgi:hypothetical protein